MYTVGVGYKILHNFTPYINDVVVETEVNKGFSRCNISLQSPNMMSEFFSSANPNMNIFISEDGHSIWMGKVRSIQTSGSKVNIEGEGHYSVLNYRYYNDGSDEELAAALSTYPNAANNFVGIYSGVDRSMVAIELVNTLDYDTPLLSFSLRLKQNGDVSEGNIQPFVGVGSSVLGSATITYFNPIPAKTIPKTFTTFEMRTSNISDDQLTNILVPASSTFFVGIKGDTDYMNFADASNFISIEVENGLGTGGNFWWYRDSTTSWTVDRDIQGEAVVYARGKWDYYPGDNQVNILTDILDDSEYNVDFQGIDSPNTLPDFALPLETTKHEAVEKVLSFGDSNSSPLYMYCYEYSNATGNPVMTFKKVSYSGRPHVLIKLREENNNYSIDFGDIFTSIKGIYNDSVDGFKYQTNAYFTEIPFIESRERKVEIGDANAAEADIITQLLNELGKEPVSDRQLSVSQDEVFGMMSQEHYPIYKIRAGDIIGVEHPVQNVYFNDDSDEGYFKFFVRATSYNVLRKEMRLDLSRVDEKDILASLLN